MGSPRRTRSLPLIGILLGVGACNSSDNPADEGSDAAGQTADASDDGGGGSDEPGTATSGSSSDSEPETDTESDPSSDSGADPEPEPDPEPDTIGADPDFFLELPPGIVTHSVASPAAFDGVVPQLQPGEAIVLEDGNYTFAGGRWDWPASVSGEPDKPIYIVGETLGGVEITGDREWRFNGRYLVIAGLTFKHQGGAVRLQGDNFRLAGNRFIESEVGSVGIYASDGEIDNNWWMGSRRQSVWHAQPGITCGNSCTYFLRNHIHHNTWKDIPRLLQNGGEAIMLGYGYAPLPPTYDNGLYATIERNIFSNARGDGEVISVKSGENTIRHNCFEKNGSGGLVIRMGSGNTIDLNTFLDNETHGVRISGDRNRIVDNFFQSQGGFPAIAIHNAGSNGEQSPYGNLTYIASTQNTIRDNVFQDFGTVARDYNIIGDFVAYSTANELIDNFFSPDIEGAYTLNANRSAEEFANTLGLQGNRFSATPQPVLGSCEGATIDQLGASGSP